jgi:hypothetical protein
MTARSENRYKQNSMASLSERNQKIAEIESLSLRRHPNPAHAAKLAKPTNMRSVKIWMQANASDCETATQLAEAAAANFKFASDPLDDETHWIWDLALDALPGA